MRHQGRRLAYAALVLTLGLAGCGRGGTPQVTPGDDAAQDEADDAQPVDLAGCPAWDDPRDYTPPPEEQPEPDPALTTANVNPDLPVEEGEDGATPDVQGELIGAARDWALAAAPDHFAGLWFDREYGATVMAFTDDVDGYAAELRERFGAGWWVVEAEHSYAELTELQREVHGRSSGGSAASAGEPGTVVGVGLREDRQLVAIDVVGGDDAALAALADEFDHPAVCFEVQAPPPTYDPDGPVRTLATVEGWRDEGAEPSDARLEIADDRETAERAFAENVPDDLPPGDGDPAEDGLHAELDSVDWEREAVVVWSGGRSSGCPVWIEDIAVEGGAVVVREASSAGACPADFNPFRAILAVSRDQLPAPEELPLPLAGYAPEQGAEARSYPAG